MCHLVQEEQDHGCFSHLCRCTHAKKVNSELQLAVLQKADSKSRGGGSTVPCLRFQTLAELVGKSIACWSVFIISHRERQPAPLPVPLSVPFSTHFWNKSCCHLCKSFSCIDISRLLPGEMLKTQHPSLPEAVRATLVRSKTTLIEGVAHEEDRNMPLRDTHVRRHTLAADVQREQAPYCPESKHTKQVMPQQVCGRSHSVPAGPCNPIRPSELKH